MAKQTDISSILKIVGKVLSDARFQECVTTIVSELLKQATADKETVADTVKSKTQSDAPVKKQVKKSGLTTTEDLSKLSEAALQARYYYRKKLGKLIEADLNAELARRFKKYNPETQQFKITTKRGAEYSEMSDKCLRSKYEKLKKQNKEIDAKLSAELERRFPGYNPETQQFWQKNKIDFTTATNRRLYHEFAYYTSHNLEIPDELNQELARRFPRYNPTTKQFTKTDYTKSPDNSLRNLYYYSKSHGKPIKPELNKELARRFPNYNPATHTFNPIVTKKVEEAPTIVKTPSVPAQISDEELINQYDRLKQAFRPIGVALNAQLTERFPGKYDPITQTFTNKPKKEEPKPVQPVKPVDLHVTLKQRKMTLQDAYYDVIVNGKTVLSNHVNTELRTFLDGTVLAVQGIVMNDPAYPQKPIWLIFDTKLQPNRFVSRDKFSGYRTYINALQETSNDLRAICSNKSTVILELDKYKRIANGARFVLDEKAK